MNLSDALMKLAADPAPLVDPDTAKAIGDRARTMLGSKDPASTEQLRLMIGRGRAGFGFGARIPDRTVLERMAGSGTAPTGGWAGRMLNKLPGTGEPDAERISGTSTAKAPTTGSYNTYDWGGLGAPIKRETSIGRTFTEGQRTGIRTTLDSPEFKGRDWFTGKAPVGTAKPAAAPAPAAVPAAPPADKGPDAKGVEESGKALNAWHQENDKDPIDPDAPKPAAPPVAPAPAEAPARGPLSAPQTPHPGINAPAPQARQDPPDPEVYKKPMTWSAPQKGPNFGVPTKSWSPHG